MSDTMKNLLSLLDNLSKGTSMSKKVQKSVKWFKDTAKDIAESYESGVKNVKDLIPVKQVKPPIPSGIEYIGKMCSFVYVPRGRDKLPYYDVFPLVFIVKRYKDGFLGLNMHYLDPRHRQVLLNRLYSIMSDKKMDSKTRVKLSYEVLKGSSKFKLAKPCIKRYKNSGIRSKLSFVPAKEWNIAIHLPTEKFKGSSKSSVWKDSINKI